jgi:hypothetical protein
MATELFGSHGIPVAVGPYQHDTEPAGLRLGVRPFDATNVGAAWTSLPTAVPTRFFKPNSQLRITATGTMWSGVWFTGDTDPDGWPDFGSDGSFLLPGPTIPRYSLVYALVEGDEFPTDPSTIDWFFAGRGPVTVAGELSEEALAAHGGDAAAAMADPAFFKRLYLAVNRPPTNGPADNGGERAWTVTVRCTDFTMSDLPTCSGASPGPTTPAGWAFCNAARAAITAAPTGPISRADRACAAAREARDRLAGFDTGLGAAVAVCVGAYGGLVALLVIAPAAALPAAHQGAAVPHVAFTALDALGAVIAAVLAAPIGVGIGVAEELGGVLTTIVTVLTGGLAVLGALAIEAAVQVTVLWYWIAIAIALAFALAMLILVLAEAAAVAAAGRDLDTADFQFAHALQDYDLAVAQAAQLCCSSNLSAAETTRPTCF